jgi:hypothetical protein
MIQFANPDDAKNALDHCETHRTHPSIKSSASRVLELIKKEGAAKSVDGTPSFKFSDVE